MCVLAVGSVVAPSGAAHVVADPNQVVDGGRLHAVLLLIALMGQFGAYHVLADVEVLKGVVDKSTSC